MNMLKQEKTAKEMSIARKRRKAERGAGADIGAFAAPPEPALPSLDQLRATSVGLIQAPATKIARTVSEPAAQLARIFTAYAAKEAA